MQQKSDPRSCVIRSRGKVNINVVLAAHDQLERGFAPYCRCRPSPLDRLILSPCLACSTLSDRFGSRHGESVHRSLALDCAGAVTSGACNLCQAGAYQSGTGQALLSDALRAGRVHSLRAACIVTRVADDGFRIYCSAASA